MFRWLAKANPRLEGRFEEPKQSGLPDPNAEENPSVSAAFEAANEDVSELSSTSVASKRKHSFYHEYDAETKAKISKYACDHGVAKAVRHFTEKLGHPIKQEHDSEYAA